MSDTTSLSFSRLGRDRRHFEQALPGEKIAIPGAIARRDGSIKHVELLHVERAISATAPRVAWNLSGETTFDLFLTKEVVMDWNRVEGNWKQVKGKVKEQWGKLTDDDLDRIAGKRDQLEGKIQERYGIERDRARRDIDDWYKRQGW